MHALTRCIRRKRNGIYIVYKGEGGGTIRYLGAWKFGSGEVFCIHQPGERVFLAGDVCIFFNNLVFSIRQVVIRHIFYFIFNSSPKHFHVHPLDITW